MTQGLFIGIHGRKHSGKSTCANYLRDNYQFHILSMADPLRLGVSAMFDWSLESMKDENIKDEIDPDLGFSRRKALQVIGTEGVREQLGADTWIKLMKRRKAVYDRLAKPSRSVIDDIRFEDEADYVRGNGGHILHLDRPSLLAAVDSHTSEKGIVRKSGDLILTNYNGMLYQLHACLDEVYRIVIGRTAIWEELPAGLDFFLSPDGKEDEIPF